MKSNAAPEFITFRSKAFFRVAQLLISLSLVPSEVVSDLLSFLNSAPYGIGYVGLGSYEQFPLF
jgi:hypothetical protein